MAELNINHNAGFFSCCSVRLHDIINFFNNNLRLPTSINYSSQLHFYKKNYTEDINLEFFLPPTDIDIKFSNPVIYHWDDQFKQYSNIPFNDITPFIQKFFTISTSIEQLIKKFELDYNIIYENTIAVFYRGNDKSSETTIGSYIDFFKKAEELIKENPQRCFLVQTDEIEFREEFKSRFKNTFFFSELPSISKNQTMVVHNTIDLDKRKDFAMRFLAATICISRCKAIITHSGNCGIWAILFRGHCNNVYQYLNHDNKSQWFIS